VPHARATSTCGPTCRTPSTGGSSSGFRDTVWTSGCMSWYTTAGGKQVNNWPGFTFTYRRATRRPDPRDLRVTV
jgi:hypothetical protein